MDVLKCLTKVQLMGQKILKDLLMMKEKQIHVVFCEKAATLLQKKLRSVLAYVALCL